MLSLLHSLWVTISCQRTCKRSDRMHQIQTVLNVSVAFDTKWDSRKVRTKNNLDSTASNRNSIDLGGRPDPIALAIGQVLEKNTKVAQTSSAHTADHPVGRNVICNPHAASTSILGKNLGQSLVVVRGQSVVTHFVAAQVIFFASDRPCRPSLFIAMRACSAVNHHFAQGLGRLGVSGSMTKPKKPSTTVMTELMTNSQLDHKFRNR